MTRSVFLRISAALAACWITTNVSLAVDAAEPAQTIPMIALDTAPLIDGQGGDWADVPPTRVGLRKTRPGGTVEVAEIEVKGGTFGDRVYLYLRWPDAHEDTLHKPWVWDAQQKKYVKGPQREDRLAVQFAIDGDYTTNWRAGQEFTADTWHWKASRSNPIGLAHDKSLIMSRRKMLRGYKLELQDADLIYLSRPNDTGDKLYKTKRYRRFERKLMPKYVLGQSPAGSVADVAAKGVWANGIWQLELSRLRDTGHADDAVFPDGPGRLAGGIAVFDRSENDDHAISDVLSFDFQPTR